MRSVDSGVSYGGSRLIKSRQRDRPLSEVAGSRDALKGRYALPLKWQAGCFLLYLCSVDFKRKARNQDVGDGENQDKNKKSESRSRFRVVFNKQRF